MSESTGTEWLTRNARELTFNEGSNPHERAKENYMKPQSQVMELETVDGRWQVALAGSDRVHDVLLLKAPAGDYAGACGCEGFTKGQVTCAHLWFVRIMESLEDLSVPESSNKYAKVMEQSSEPPEPGDKVDPSVGDERLHYCPQCDYETTQHLYHNGNWICQKCEAQLAPDYDHRPEATEEPQETAVVEEAPMPAQPTEPDTNGAEPPQRADAFAEPLPDVGEEYVMTMGGEKYIRRAGYARLGRQAGLSHSVQLMVGDAAPTSQVTMKATVRDEEGNEWQDWGTAGPAEHEDMDGAEANLIELAATRALTRAYAWATGEGLTAVAEVQPGEDR